MQKPAELVIIAAGPPRSVPSWWQTPLAHSEKDRFRVRGVFAASKFNQSKDIWTR